MSEFPSAAACEPLAVIGLSCLFPQADDVAAFWSNIRRGVDAITEIPTTHWRPEDYFDADPKSSDMTYARRGGFLSPVAFDPLEYGIAPSNLEAIDTSQLLGLVAAKRALDDALSDALQKRRIVDRSRIGCILGVTGTLEMVIPLGARLGHPKWRQALKDAGVADDVAEDVIQRIGESYVPWQENSFPGLLGNVVAGRIANRLDLGGTNCVVDAACASSLSAMHLAALELWSGRADMMITGGIDTFNDIFMYMCFSKTPALSPTGDARPFSDAADGTILGEGVGMFVLKRLSDAERDGDRIYALIRGIGTSSDGAGNAVYAPKKEGQIRCLQDAYQVAGVSPDTVELIEAHGTGTKVGDATELAGLTEVFQAAGKTGRWCAVGSIKSQIGHTKAAAGAAGVMKAILALRHRVLPPTIKVDRPLPSLIDEQSPLYASLQARPWLAAKDHPRRAGVSAFGFGGSNFHCVLEESPHTVPEIDWDDDVCFAAWSAESREELAAKLQAWTAANDTREVRRRCAEARRAFQPSHPHRLTIVAESAGDMRALVASAQRYLTLYANKSAWSTPDGIHYGSGPWAGKLGLLFPGQGSQYVHMQRELACRFPALQDVLNQANEVFNCEHGLGSAKSEVGSRKERILPTSDFRIPPSLSDIIYPIPAFDDASRDRQDAALRNTEVAQPALGAVSLGLLAILAEFGVKPDVVAGHSYGELTALCASKRFAPAALYRLSMLRGRLMAEAQEIEGGMLAVGAPLSQVETALKEAAVDLVIANRNSPTQAVLSGRIAELDRAAEFFARKNIRGKRLPVAAAFHSPLVAAASERFQPVLEEIEFGAAEVPVFANTHAREYPDDPAAARSLLANQLAQPVEFVQQIENMEAAGVNVFLEVGPGSVLTGLVGSILSGREHRAIAVDASGGKRSGMTDLAAALAQLAAIGLPIDLAAWDPSPPAALQAADPQRLTIPICGANYVKPHKPRPPAKRQANGESRSEKSEVGSRKEENPLRPSTFALPPSNPQPATHNSQPLAVLQQMFEQTARLHQQFLTSQSAALETLEALAMGTLVAHALPGEVRRVAEESRKSEVGSRKDEDLLPPSSFALPTSNPQPPTPNPQLASLVLAVVAEKTGYPVEMLKPEMSLDHDLGVDSIKRVEILSALQERRPDLPAVTPEQLQTIHRLEDVIALLGESQESRVESPEPARKIASNPQPPTPNPQLASLVLAVVAEKTGYPVEMLKPEMSLDHDLGVDSIKRVEILSALQERRPDLPAATPEQLQTIHRLSDVIALLGESQESSVECPEPDRKIISDPQPSTLNPQRSTLTLGVPRTNSWSGGNRLQIPAGGEILVTDDGSELSRKIVERLTQLGASARMVRLDEAEMQSVPESLAGLIVVAPADGMSDHDLWHALEWTQKCGPALRRAARRQPAVFATISRVDGRFGLDRQSPARDPLSGALAGLAKTVRHEWPEVVAKAIDLAAGPTDVADLVERLLSDGPAEIGLSASGWSQIEVVAPDAPAESSAPIHPGDLLLITGGARGVTAACAIAAAEAWRPRIVLCGRTALAAEPDWLAGRQTAAEVKQAIAQHGPAGASLREIDQLAKRFLANREVCETLQEIRDLGVDVEYVALDIRDADAVRSTMQELETRLGPIRGLIHGAGVLEDRKIEDKTREQFDNVFTTKVVGLRNLLGAIDAEALKCLAVFSSYTARYGRVGQVDYAMANEALNKLVGEFHAKHPACRVRSFNWGPWDGGMVTDSLKPLFAKEGVGLIPLAAGAELLVRELERDDNASIELVVLAEREQERGDFSDSQPAANNPQPTNSRVGWERTLDLDCHRYLVSHVIGGKAVLPTAMIVECLAHAALHSHPGLEFVGLNRLRVFKGVRLGRGDKVALQALTEKAIRDRGEFRVPARLVSQENSRPVFHAEAEILLSGIRPELPSRKWNESSSSRSVEIPQNWYGSLLFHGPLLHGLTKVLELNDRGITVTARSAPPPGEWLSEPWRAAWLADPLAIDVALQAIIVWTQTIHQRASLPTAIRAYRQFRRAFPGDGLQIAVRAERRNETSVDADAKILDANGAIVAELEGVEYVLDGQLTAAFGRNRVE